jgi:hypothetical protein
MAEGFLLGPNLLSQVRRTIDRVEGEVIGSGVRRIPTVIEGEDGRRQTVFRICTFTGAWNIGEEKNVRIKYLEGETNTANVTNLFFPFPPPPENSTIDCAIARDGTAWFLIDVPFATETAVFIGAMASQEVVSNVTPATSTINYISAINIAASLNTSNCSITVNTNQTTASATFVSSVVRSTASIRVVTSTFTASFVSFKVS